MATPAKQQTQSVSIELPMTGSDGPEQSADEMAEELRLLWILNQVRRHHLTTGQGAQLAEMPRASFMQLMGEHGIPVFDYPVEELQDELEFLRSRRA